MGTSVGLDVPTMYVLRTSLTRLQRIDTRNEECPRSVGSDSICVRACVRV